MTVADRRALTRVGLSFGVLTVVVTLIGAAVVKQHIDSQPGAIPSDIAENSEVP